MDPAIAKEMVKRGTWYIPTAVVTLMEMTFIKNNDELVTGSLEIGKQADLILELCNYINCTDSNISSSVFYAVLHYIKSLFIVYS